jgi:DNA-binding NarL/FixJ family response regulator
MKDAALRGRRILVVEDEMLLAMEMESLLEQQGCVVLGPASDVSHAMHLLESERPDAAVLDLNLKGVHSTAVAASLAARNVPFVIVTGYGEAQSTDQEWQGRPRLSKPVTERALVRALANILGCG